MRIFVTGATGYLGFHFVNVAISSGHKVLCLRRSTSKSLFEPIIENQVEWVNNDGKLKEVVESFEPDVLVHAAWGGVRGNDRNNKDVQSKNIEMSDMLFRLFPYKQIISIGSQSEYGFYNNVVSEEHPLNPTLEYAKAKVICCNHLKKYCEQKNIEWQWIRVFTVFGEKQTGGLIRTITDKCLNKESLFPTTKGDQLYSYLYSFDFAKALCNVLGSQGKSGIYNLSQPLELHSNRDILERIKRILKSNIQFDYGAIPYPEDQIMYMDGSVTKFENAFGKIPCTNFDLALTNTITSFM